MKEDILTQLQWISDNLEQTGKDLRALCQRCHNRYDAEHRKETRLSNSIKKKDK